MTEIESEEGKEEKGEISMDQFLTFILRQGWKLLLLLIWGGIGTAKVLILLRSWNQVVEPQLFLVLIVAALTIYAAFGPSRYRRVMMRLWVIPTLIGLTISILLYEYEALSEFVILPPLSRIMETVKDVSWESFVLGAVTMIVLWCIDREEDNAGGEN